MKLDNSNLVNELPSITISISTIAENLNNFINNFPKVENSNLIMSKKTFSPL